MWKRLKRLWELSNPEEEEGFEFKGFVKPVNQKQELTTDELKNVIYGGPKKAIFIPRIKNDPVKAITEEKS